MKHCVGVDATPLAFIKSLCSCEFASCRCLLNNERRRRLTAHPIRPQSLVALVVRISNNRVRHANCKTQLRVLQRKYTRAKLRWGASLHCEKLIHKCDVRTFDRVRLSEFCKLAMALIKIYEIKLDFLYIDLPYKYFNEGYLIHRPNNLLSMIWFNYHAQY